MRIYLGLLLSLSAFGVSAGNMYIYKDESGQTLLTSIGPSDDFDKFTKKVRRTYYKDDSDSISEQYSSDDPTLNELSKLLMEREKEEREKQRQLAKKPDAKIGMSENQVLNNSKWGQPKDIVTTIDSSGKTEKWLYGNQKYLYFKNGKLASIHY